MVAQLVQSFAAGAWATIFLSIHVATQTNLSMFSETLQMISTNVRPHIENIGHSIYVNPETALEEYFATSTTIGYFDDNPFNVTKQAYGFETFLKLTFENLPAGYGGNVPTLAFLLEYDALPEVKHACGHNLIATVGLTAATMTREALLYYNIPARVVVHGCFDEEDTDGKRLLLNAGAFDDEYAIFMMANPTATSAVQPMQARIDVKVELSGSTHFEVVGKTYQVLATIQDLADSPPGHSSTASSIEQIGMGRDVAFATQAYTLSENESGVVIMFTGPGRHASEGNKLGITVSVRPRYTVELEEVRSYIDNAIWELSDSVTYDIPYPALEVHEELGQYFIDLMATPEFSDNSWAFSSIAPAATDASLVQNPTINETSYELLSTSRVIFHPNYGICDTSTVASCPFNHEPEFDDIADLDYAYMQAERWRGR
ncbi:uncharacterized protein BT62DRAFT_1070667 [Guyanagaster necrorhizus]|uniref:Peptidase M20 domain-containing protein 2 n=1 Tax=Guyanagaster necrorhizus TaxID=856835 RepID=A0A9P7W5C6_9AGAR|nr:uncharacterized protein BT62DRAFT_1070667 [Guyanagaster necrorhizus MCA 3950]KAG7452968.1 hypothetical protein BT62DRAFT_1070667 [Guyanagaster necrorhizus MCA 3950]